MNTQRFRALSSHQRALVAVAVLLDGLEATIYLKNDALNGDGLAKAAEELCQQEPNLRMPLLGSELRQALAELEF